MSSVHGNLKIWKESPCASSNSKAGREQDRIISGADWLNNENSTYFSGSCLFAQVRCYEATRNPSALEECKRALRSLKGISALPPERSFGWLCKPFGMMVTTESSPDQNLAAVSGMRAYLPHADDADRDWIISMICAIAGYWHRIDYQLDFGHIFWDMRKSPGHMRIMQVINQVAFELEGDSHYSEVAAGLAAEYGEISSGESSQFDLMQRLNPAIFSNWTTTSEAASAGLLFVLHCGRLLIDLAPENRKTLLAAMERALLHGLIGFDESTHMHRYYQQVRKDADGLHWRPLPEDFDEPIRTGVPFFEASRDLFYLDPTSRFPAAYSIYLTCGGDPNSHYEGIWKTIMGELDFSRLHWFIAGNEIDLSRDYLFSGITSELSNYLVAYWLGKSQGLC